MQSIQPNFLHPPLVEQAISILFDSLPRFSIGDFGIFWSAIQSDFPVCDAQPLQSETVESFGDFNPARIEFRLISQDELPRCVYRKTNGSELIQIQRDRLTFNWSSAGGDHYPRFASTLVRFWEIFDMFAAVATSRSWGEINVKQCELTNVNITTVKEIGGTLSDAGNAFRLPVFDVPACALEFESTTVQNQYLMIREDGRPFGRLHTMLMPVKRVEDDELALRYTLTARGAPKSSDRSSITDFFQAARSAINATFMASTTNRAHDEWGYIDG